MVARKTTVTLTNGTRTERVELEQAERLLNWLGSGWVLADSRYEFIGGNLLRKKGKK